MSVNNKYRVHEVAKDFGLTSKIVSDILVQYQTAPKNHMQALTDTELNVIFDYLTQHNQIANIELVFAHTYREPAPPPKPEATPAEKQPETPSKPQTEAQSGEAKAAVPPPKQQAKPGHQVTTQPKHTGERTRIVDTRGGNVNLEKYDERVDKHVPHYAEKLGPNQQGKQKIKKTDNRRPAAYSQKRRQEEQEKIRRLQMELRKKQQLKITIGDEIAVAELASRLKKTGTEVVKQLMKLGVMASLSQVIDYDTASLVAMELGAKVEREVIVTIEERLIDDSADAEQNLEQREPVVVVMGHVDHGKTSLLDAIRATSVTEGEAGGITQHIGAYRVPFQDRHITFLDTPGHAAFTSMRARGAQATDIAILVVAADDGIMPQTVEAINHAKAAEVPIVVAINKMDKETADPSRIQQQLTEYELLSEEWGGDTIVCPVSAKTKQGLDHLLEMVMLVAEMRQLRANPNRAAKGVVIEAFLDKGRGPVATLLVQNGTLKAGDTIIAGATVGNVRAMTNEHGTRLTEAGPSMPVEVTGLSETPGAGDLFFAVGDERMARELVEQRKETERNEKSKAVTAVSLDTLFSQIKEGQVKELKLVIKADVQGSAEAVKASLEKLGNEEVRVRIIHAGVGAINEGDILLSATSNAILIGFNVRPDGAIRDSAARHNVDIRLYRVIYECIEEMEAAMKGMLAPKFREVVLGRAEIRQVFKVTGVGAVAGCYVQDGKILRNAKVRLLRESVVIHEGELASLKRFKDDAREVASGFECGMGIERYNDIKEGDIIEAFTMEEVE